MTAGRANGNRVILPGFIDVHVHFREPGFSYKETIATGTAAAKAGGYRAVCTMPNLKPVPDSVENLLPQLEKIARDACVNVYPYGALTINEAGIMPADIEGLAPMVTAFSDDGKGVQSRQMMEGLMRRVADCGKLIAAHCEDNSLLRGGYIHEGRYALYNGHKGILSESEWGPIARDVELAAKTGCPYHVCHVSAKESVEIIRQAKRSGIDVTCETAPHYLLLDETDLQEDGRFKMNPPLRGSDDRLALIEGVKDGTVDIVATDHAPHSREEKAKGLSGSAFGVVGLETAFPLLYTYLVLPGIITLSRLLELMVYAPEKRFRIPAAPEAANVWDLDEEWIVAPEQFKSKGRATPFEAWRVRGKLIGPADPEFSTPPEETSEQDKSGGEA